MIKYKNKIRQTKHFNQIINWHFYQIIYYICVFLLPYFLFYYLVIFDTIINYKILELYRILLPNFWFWLDCNVLNLYYNRILVNKIRYKMRQYKMSLLLIKLLIFAILLSTIFYYSVFWHNICFLIKQIK